jgi:flagellar hook-basal body complex protein FliE
MSPISAYMPSMGAMPNVDSLTPETTQLNGAGIPNLAALTMENSSLTGAQGTTGAAGVTGPGMPIEMPSELSAPAAAGGVSGGNDTFASMLGNLVSDVNDKQQVAGQSVAALQSGQTMPLHQAVIAMEEANVSFQLMVEVRNRLLDAYQEVMRMQV